MRYVFLILLCAGCDTLFPEFAGKPPVTDASSADADATPGITGVLCSLGDVRDLNSCASGVPGGMHVTVEETRDAANVDATGHFALPLSQILETATLAAVDPSFTYTPTVTSVRLAQGRALGLAVPMVQTQLLQDLALQNGLVLDDNRGIVLGWVTDSKGTPIANVAASAMPGADGPFYDGTQPGEIQPGRGTLSHGLVAFFNVPPGAAQLSAGGVQFQLPVRANAVTLSVLIAAP